MNYYKHEQIGPKQSLTKEGWLLCEDVPLARTGQMTYAAGEVPIPAGPDGIILIDRFPEDVFRPETLASINGKDVVNEHPDEDVNPDNWQWLTAGVVLNPRRGTGAQDDLILGDLMIKNPAMIAAVRGGKRELSLGYDADYLQAMAADGVTPLLGRGKQINILVNHCALVEAGRCGPRCAIGDSKAKEQNMTWLEKVKAAFGAKDEAALNAALAEAPKGDNISLTTDQLKTVAQMTRDAMKKDDDEDEDHKTMDARMKKVEDAVDAIGKDVKGMKDELEKKKKDEEEEEEETHDNEKILGEMELEAPPGTSDGIAAKAQDGAFMADSFQEAASLAEIIAPGVQVPTFDAKADKKKTFDTLCRFRKTVLDLAFARPELRSHMDALTNGRDYKTFDCGQTRTLFRAVGNHQKTLNRAWTAARDQHSVRSSGGGEGPVGNVRSIADINKKNSEYYKTVQ